MISRREQMARFRAFLRREVLPFSAFYREHFRGVDLRALREWADLERLPFTSKKDLLNSPEHPERMRDFALLPDPAPLKRRPGVIAAALWRGAAAVRAELDAEYRPIFLTSTTGRSSAPVAFLYTAQDLGRLTRSGRQLVEILGHTPDERVLNLFPYAPHLAFWQTHYATTAFGVFAVGTGGGKVMGTEGNIRLLKKIQPSALIGMPTFLYHLLRQAADEGVRTDRLRTLVLGGEKVPEGMRQKLRDLAEELGSPRVSVLATYGFTEAKMAWAECPTRDGSPSGYHLYPELALVEIVDPETGRQVPDGHGGEIVFSALDARGSVVIRYRTGDCIDGGIVPGPCPHCGRPMPRLVGAISRRSDIVEMKFDKLKGTIVNFNELEHLLDDMPEIGAWQLELRKHRDDPMDVDILILHAERTCDLPDEVIRDKVNEAFSAATELRLNTIHLHTSAEMRTRHGVGTEIKEKRILDNRPRA